jgi:phosphoenolpyruvate carboxylase
VESVLWNAVPSYCRKLDAALQSETGLALPLSFAPVTFSSWMGGSLRSPVLSLDRDQHI